MATAFYSPKERSAVVCNSRSLGNPDRISSQKIMSVTTLTTSILVFQHVHGFTGVEFQAVTAAHVLRTASLSLSRRRRTCVAWMKKKKKKKSELLLLFWDLAEKREREIRRDLQGLRAPLFFGTKGKANLPPLLPLLPGGSWSKSAIRMLQSKLFFLCVSPTTFNHSHV